MLSCAFPTFGLLCLMPQITAANAREMAAKSQEVRRRNKAERDMAREAEPATPQSVLQSDSQSQATDGYASRLLVRVRGEIDAILDALVVERQKKDGPDPARIDRLASAFARLAEAERQLSDRPLPGTKRPPSPTKSPSGVLDFL